MNLLYACARQRVAQFGSYCCSGPSARTFHLADRVFYWYQYYFVIQVLSRQLYF